MVVTCKFVGLRSALDAMLAAAVISRLSSTNSNILRLYPGSIFGLEPLALLAKRSPFLNFRAQRRIELSETDWSMPNNI